MKSVRGAAVMLAMFASLVAAGCGGGRGKSSTAATTAPPPVTKDAYIAQADQLCKKYNTQIDAVVGGGHDPSTRAATQHAVVNLLHQNIAALRALGYPPGDKQTLSPIWDGVDHALDKVNRAGIQANLEQSLGQALGPWLAKMNAYGIRCQPSGGA